MFRLVNKRTKEENIIYHRVHGWLRFHFPKPNSCDNKKCEGKSHRYGWAKKRGCKYEKVRSNFMRLCARCHSQYDLTPEGRQSLRRHGKERVRPPEACRKQSLSMKAHYQWLKEHKKMIVGQPKSKPIDGRFYCKHCHKITYRKSDKEWIKSVCGETGKTVHLQRLYEDGNTLVSSLSFRGIR